MTKNLTKETLIEYIARGVALLFCVFSLVFFSIRTENDKAFMSLVSILYVFIPTIAQKLFKFRIQWTLYIFIMFYTVCPLLGYSYDLYYRLHWWDDILHAFAGMVFAMLGAYLPKVLSKDEEPSLALCAFSAFFFSVAIAGLWELVEFSMDTFFGTDMQKDTLLYAMRPSYLISELAGAPVGELAEISEVGMLINGSTHAGYVDLGVIDTMKDIFVETMGAVVYVVIYRAGNGKHFIFEKATEEEIPPTLLVSDTNEEAQSPDVAAEVAPTEKEKL